MTVEFWKSFFDVGTLFLLFLTFAFGVGVLITGNIINRRQAEQIRTFETTLAVAQTGLATEQRKTAEAQTEAAKAQLALEQYLDWIGKSVDARRLDAKQLITSLKTIPKFSVEIWYESGTDEEPYSFALQLKNALGPQGVGWSVEINPFAPKRESDSGVGPAPVFDLIRRTADLQGIAFGGSDRDVGARPPSPLFTLTHAIGMSTGPLFGSQSFGDPSIPDGHVIIAIGPHRPNIPAVEFTHPKK